MCMCLRTFNPLSKDNPLRNSQAVKKGVALCKKARVKKVGQEMAVMVQVDGKKNNVCCLVPASHSTELLLI